MTTCSTARAATIRSTAKAAWTRLPTHERRLLSTVDLRITDAANAFVGTDSDTLVDIENVTGSDFADTLIGDEYENVLVGGGGADTLQGAGGIDVLRGGAGADRLFGYLEGALSGDDVDVDIASYEGAAAGVIVDLTLSVQAGSGEEAGDVLTGIEGLIGTARDDTLRGNAGDNWLSGGGGK